MVIKLSMYVGLHDVYPAMDVNLTFWRKVKMTAACNFISLGGEMRELLDKNGRRKKKGKEGNYWLDKKGAKFARCVAVFFGEAEWKLTKLFKVSTAWHAVNEEAQFLENFYSNHLWNMI